MWVGVSVAVGVRVGVAVLVARAFGVEVAVIVPVAVAVAVAVEVGCALVPTAAAALRRPYCHSVPVPVTASALFVIRSSTCCAVVTPGSDHTSAATPLTKGAAMDVPFLFA